MFKKRLAIVMAFGLILAATPSAFAIDKAGVIS